MLLTIFLSLSARSLWSDTETKRLKGKLLLWNGFLRLLRHLYKTLALFYVINHEESWNSRVGVCKSSSSIYHWVKELAQPLFVAFPLPGKLQRNKQQLLIKGGTRRVLNFSTLVLLNQECVTKGKLPISSDKFSEKDDDFISTTNFENISTNFSLLFIGLVVCTLLCIRGNFCYIALFADVILFRLLSYSSEGVQETSVGWWVTKSLKLTQFNSFYRIKRQTLWLKSKPMKGSKLTSREKSF